MLHGAALTGLGLAVPERVVANAAIAGRLGVDEHWIERRTGTSVRHFVAEGERLSDLAAEAGATALAQAGLDATELDLVVVATTSADELSPHAATFVAGRLGASRAGAIDVSAACVGFLSALALAVGMLEAGRARHALVIGADALSRYVDADDRGSAMLFGDGAGAAVVSAVDGPSDVGPVILGSDPADGPLIRLGREDLLIRMDGPSVYKRAVSVMCEVARDATAAAGIGLDDIDLFVFHQANGRIIRAVGQRLGLPEERVAQYVDRYANTSAASLPIALATAADEGRLRSGSRVLLAAFGAGLVWGGVVVRWRV
ncbi:MAG TPA: beta-ketoacyl-ACP synthase 3 [Solirubrobacter sp.]|nr:beta-ketoacyl-ACP synthase 3 [Solirubrobacter sp.]